MNPYELYATDGPLDRYDGVEVHPVEVDDGGCCTTISVSEIGRDKNCTYIWSVYLHYNPGHPGNEGFGGVECVADLPTAKSAGAYADGLRAALYELLDEKHERLRTA